MLNIEYLLRGVFTGAYNLGETLRTNALDAADALTGTGQYRTSPSTTLNTSTAATGAQLPSEHAGAASISTTSGPSAGIGAGLNPMRARGATVEDEARAGEVHRGDSMLGGGERAPDASYASPVTGAGAPVDAGSTGAEVAPGAPAGPGRVGGAAF